MSAGNGAQLPPRETQGRPDTRRSVFADLCQRLVTENFAPAAVLINRRREYLYSLGPTDAYLRAVPGYPTNDVFVMARTGVRAKLRSAVRQAIQENERVEVAGGRTSRDGKPLPFSIVVQPVQSEGEELLLVCFIDEPHLEREPVRPAMSEETSRDAELEQELETTRTELAEAIRDLEELTRSHTEATDATLSINEEYQAANEELETSKEELQSLNEELTALNSQLHETLERERTTADDLQNVLYSTDIATIFLDHSLNIRFFTPATHAIFSIIPSDVGRPLGDLRSLVADEALLADARTVLVTDEPIQTEVGAGSGCWYMRRIVPYHTRENGVEGVVITFTDTTEQRRARELLETARQEADAANAAKSRFLAAASHDIRQPLQTISLLQGLLAKTVRGEKAQILVGRLGETLTAMTAMLNTLHDLNRIEAGNVEPEIVGFDIDELLDRLKDEFAYHAEARGLAFRVVPCSRHIHSDPHLLEQMLRNLLSNALKYTERGKVLLGCRRRGQMLSIEVWDTGIGIADEELETIFDEYHQLDNTARETSRGLGLGLSIVKGLADILGYGVHVRSHPGKGSVFAIEIVPAPGEAESWREPGRQVKDDNTDESVRLPPGVILVVEDDPVLCELLEEVLEDEGHQPYSARDGPRALELIARGAPQPDLVVADYNLPGGMNGFQVAEKLQARLNRTLPVIVLTGDISEGTLQDAAQQNCARLTKPVELTELTQLVRRLLTPSQPVPRPHARETGDAGDNPSSPLIYVVDDDRHVHEELREVLEGDGRTVETFSTAEAFLEAYRPGREACLLLDAHLPGMDGLELLERLDGADDGLTIIMITGRGDVAMAVQAMKAGASDFMEKPISYNDLIANVEHALELSRNATLRSETQKDAARRLARLTPRQRQIMEMVLAGHPSKNIAADLGISQRTVENHRASIMKRTETESLPALARLTLAAAEIRDH